MKKLSAAFNALTFILTLTASFPGTAAPVSLQSLRLHNQHDTPVNISADTRFILFAHDMSGKDLVQDLLSKAGGSLAEHNALFIVDISAMPQLIARMFAYPAMRKTPYPILIDADGSHTGHWQRRDSALTLFRLQEFSVTGYEFIDSTAALAAALEQAASTTEEAPQKDVLSAETTNSTPPPSTDE